MDMKVCEIQRNPSKMKMSLRYIKIKQLKVKDRDCPGGAVVKNLPANAGDMGSIPRLGRSHMLQSNKAHAPQLLSLRSRAHKPQLLSPSATTTEACMPRARALQQEKPSQEKHVHHNKEQPPLATMRESPRAAMKTQCIQK